MYIPVVVDKSIVVPQEHIPIIGDTPLDVELVSLAGFGFVVVPVSIPPSDDDVGTQKVYATHVVGAAGLSTQ